MNGQAGMPGRACKRLWRPVIGLAPVTRTFESADVPRGLPDLATTESTRAVEGVSGSITGVTVSLHLAHTWDGDLVISLVGPDGTTAVLANRRGDGGENYGTGCAGRTTFDDAASTAIGEGAAPFAGSFRPDQPLSVFEGKTGAAINGTWRLRIEDQAGLDVGTLHCWSLALSTGEPVCATGTGPCQGTPTFGDVPADHPFRGWIEALVRAGITAGCGTSPARYCPASPVSRGQMAVFLLRGMAWPAPATPPTATGAVFTDVQASHPFAGWIEGLAASGVTGGCGNGDYCPDRVVTRGEMAVFLGRAFGLPQ
jgi:subtilisin-like proprotein convertase family protein